MSVRDRIKLFDNASNLAKQSPNFLTVNRQSVTPSCPSSPEVKSPGSPGAPISNEPSPSRLATSEVTNRVITWHTERAIQPHDEESASPDEKKARDTLNNLSCVDTTTRDDWGPDCDWVLCRELKELNAEIGGLDHSITIGKPLFPKPMLLSKIHH